MSKSILICFLLCCTIVTKVFSQAPLQTAQSSYTYHPPSSDKKSWQRLNLTLAANFYQGMKLSRISSDSALIYVSRALGISRLVITADGIENQELIKQSTWFDERNPGKAVNLLSQSKGKKHLELLILLGAYYSFQPSNYKLYRDSVEYFLKPALVESHKIDEKKLGRIALCLLGKLYGNGADTANGNLTFGKLIKECQEAHDRETEARAFLYRGIYTRYTGSNLEEKIGWLQKAIEIYHELKDTESEISGLTYLAFFYMVQSRFDDAYTTFLKTLELQKSIDYPYTNYTTDHIAMITLLQEKFGEPLKYTLESIRVAEATRDSLGLAEYYLRLGQLYYMEGGRNEESLKWMFKALNRIVAINDGNIYSTLFNVVNLMTENPGRGKEALNLVKSMSEKMLPLSIEDKVFQNLSFATCYIFLKEYDSAARYISSADAIRKQSPAVTFADVYQQNAISDLTNSLNFERGEYRKVKKYLEEALADSDRLSVLADQIDGYKRLIYIDSVFGDHASGVKHYKQYTALLDSNFRASKIRQAEELQVMYQTKEKEDRINILNQQAKLEQASLKQATIVKNLTIAGIIAVLIIAALLFRQSRLRKKNNNAITQKNELLQHFLTEKEWLLKEIHHRVKNNLQIVMSLLNSQSAYIDNEPALAAIHDSQRRVHAMSLIHQKLYNTDNVSSIDMSSYIRELASYLSDSFNNRQQIRFEYNIEDLELDVSQAVPLGLILNEAITNSIKYAFPDNRSGVISISLVHTSASRYLLTIADNGIGMPDRSATTKIGSLGMSLMAGLSEDLDGNFSILNNNGTTIRISFAHYHDIKSPGNLELSSSSV